MSTDDGDADEFRRQIVKLLRPGVTVKSIKQSMEDDPQGPVAKAIHETIVKQ
jgi:DNA-binding transcriptional MerR regulator